MNKKNASTEPAQETCQHLTKEQRLTQAFLKLPKGRVTRLVSFLILSTNPSTACIASICSIGNVADAAILANEVLSRYGLQIIHYPPKPRIQNKFGEVSMMHVWELVDLEVTQ